MKKIKLQDFEIREIPIEDINPAQYNPRRDFTDAELKAFEANLDKFGCVELLVWNERTGNLVGGHKRFAWLKKKGATKVRVAVVDLNDKDEKTLNLALNRQGLGLWDEEKLEILLEELHIENIDLELTGFNEIELASLLSIESEDFDPEKEWEGMPEYRNQNLSGYRILHIHFRNKKAVEDFIEKLRIKITDRTSYIWYPQDES
jgi:ParB-like chromosome segregation protein Spo0J